MGYIYDFGAHAALQKLGMDKTARRRLQDPDAMFYGDQELGEDVRLNEMEQLIAAHTSRELPPESVYKQEGGRSGATVGGVSGGLLGGGLGLTSLKQPGKKGLIGAAIGAAAGGGLGYMGGRAQGSEDYKDDLSLQGEMSNLEGKQDRQKAHLARMKQQRDAEQAWMKQQHEMELADMERRRLNTNINYDM